MRRGLVLVWLHAAHAVQYDLCAEPAHKRMIPGDVKKYDGVKCKKVCDETLTCKGYGTNNTHCVFTTSSWVTRPAGDGEHGWTACFKNDAFVRYDTMDGMCDDAGHDTVALAAGKAECKQLCSLTQRCQLFSFNEHTDNNCKLHGPFGLPDSSKRARRDAATFGSSLKWSGNDGTGNDKHLHYRVASATTFRKATPTHSAHSTCTPAAERTRRSQNNCFCSVKVAFSHQCIFWGMPCAAGVPVACFAMLFGALGLAKFFNLPNE